MLREALKRFRGSDFLPLFGVLLAILGAKFYLIQHYGSDLPFWDQWDAEGDRLYLSDARGTLSLNDFLAPHNEHRILFTKILAYGLEKLTGQWDARLEMTVNAFISVSAIGLLLVFLRRGLRRSSWSGACVVAFVFSALPLAWENTLGGFQSQFYFLLFFSIAHLGGTFSCADKSRGWWLGQLAGICAVFSMGSGFFSAAIAVGLIALDIIKARRLSRPNTGLLIYNVSLVVIGLFLRTEVAGHETLKAHGIVQFMTGLGLVLAWPSPFLFSFALTVLPVAIVIFRIVQKPARIETLFTLALSGWWFLQAVALAFARGGTDSLLSSRYFDLLSLGALVSAICWQEIAFPLFKAGRQQTIIRILYALWIIIIILGLRSQLIITKQDFLDPLPGLTEHRIATVKTYVESESPDFFRAKPFIELPYPNVERLGGLLREPGIKAILPVSVRAALPVQSEPGTSTGFFQVQRDQVPGAPVGSRLWSSERQAIDRSASFRSDWISKPGFHFLRFFVIGFGADEKNSLWIETAVEKKQIEFPKGAENRWKSVVIEAPSESFRFVAASAPGSSLAFTEPAEMSVCSWLCRHLLKLGPTFFVAGLLLLASIFFAKIRKGPLPAFAFSNFNRGWLIVLLPIGLFIVGRSGVFSRVGPLIPAFLRAADQHLWRFRFVALAAPLLFCLYSIYKIISPPAFGKNKQFHHAWIGGLFLAIILVGRWPYLFLNTFFSPDESQQLAGGLTLLHHPIFWRDVDGHTAGPLNFYFLSALGWLGFPLTYSTGRFAAIVLQSGSLWCVYRIFRLSVSREQACFAITPLLCFYTWMNNWDTIMFSTEQVPTLLLIASLYYLLLYQSQVSPSARALFWSGVLAGLSPWSKLQAAPAALALFFGAVALTFIKRESNIMSATARRYLYIGFALPTAIFLVLILLTNQFDSFFQSYLAANLLYTAAGLPWLSVVQQLWDLTETIHGLIIVTLFWGLFAGITLIVYHKRPSLQYTASILAALVGLFTCLAPARGFPHYTLFIIAPFGLCIGISFVESVRSLNPRKSLFLCLAAFFFTISTVPFLLYRLRWTGIPETRFAAYWSLPDSTPARILRPYLGKEDTLAVWGWYPHLYVELQIAQGVRDAHSEREMSPSGLEKYYQSRYLSDLRTNRPTAFVDAVGPNSQEFTDQEKFGLQAFPLIQEFVESEYKLIYNTSEARIYLRKDRI